MSDHLHATPPWLAAGRLASRVMRGVGSAAVDLVLVIGCIGYLVGSYIMGLLLWTRWHL